MSDHADGLSDFVKKAVQKAASGPTDAAGHQIKEPVSIAVGEAPVVVKPEDTREDRELKADTATATQLELPFDTPVKELEKEPEQKRHWTYEDVVDNPEVEVFGTGDIIATDKGVFIDLEGDWPRLHLNALKLSVRRGIRAYISKRRVEQNEERS